MQAMILAAGFGTRLLPHTSLRPKPLFPVLNVPLLLATIRRLQRAGVRHIIVNCHHLKEQIVAALTGIDGVVIQQEEDILGTGGGLRRALSSMRDEPLLVTNGDIYHTVEYRRLYAAQRQAGVPVLLAIHDFPRFNGVRVQGDRVAGFRSEGEGTSLAFTGLSVIQPATLADIADDRASCIIDHFQNLLEQGVGIGVHRVDDCFWTDMGTPADYLDLHAGLLTGRIPRWQELPAPADKVVVDSRARLTGASQLHDWCAIGAATGRGISLSRCVVWDGVALPDNFCAADQLISASPV